MNPRIIAISGPSKGQVFSITENELRVGRAADNTVVLDDALVSRCHFAVWIKDGQVYLRDRDTDNGTWVNDEAQVQRFLKQGDRIKCGSTIFLYLELTEDPEALPQIMEDETDRSRQFDTVRADLSAAEDAAVRYEGINQIVFQMVGALNAITDAVQLQEQIIDLGFEVVPALRGAILLNGNRVSPDPADFISQVCRERGFDGPARFVFSGNVLREVYAEKQARISNNVTPVMCVPLITSGALSGVLYMEGTQTRHGFEVEHLSHLKGIAEITITALRLAGIFKQMRNERDLAVRERPAPASMIGGSVALRKVLEKMRKAAATDASVLITGESGTGKELVARGIHAMSTRAEHPFAAINCGAISETLLESELFGHVKGAFTGATAARDGYFAMANGGTVFLDEIGEMTNEAQKRLLRVLQEREVVPVGGHKPVPVDIRVITATHVNLEAAVRQGKFREDLFYRLNVFPIEVPPLRERTEDIPELSDHFLKKYSRWRNVTGIAPDAMEVLMAYSWPGNVRDLENAMYFVVANGDSETVLLEDLPPRVLQRPAAGAPGLSFREIGQQAARQAQKAVLEARLKENGNNMREAADYFRISLAYAYRLL